MRSRQIGLVYRAVAWAGAGLFGACATNDAPGSAANASAEVTAQAGLDVNDVSMLFPVPDRDNVWRLMPLTATLSTGRDILPAPVFDAIADIARRGRAERLGALSMTPEVMRKLREGSPFGAEDFEEGGGPGLDLDAVGGAQRESYRVVSLRFDPCAPPAPADAGAGRTQVRLVAQPFVGDVPQDAAAHLMYDVPFAAAREIAEDLLSWRDPASVGQPLGVHPVMREQGLAGPLFEQASGSDQSLRLAGGGRRGRRQSRRLADRASPSGTWVVRRSSRPGRR